MYNYTNADHRCVAKLALIIIKVFDESSKYCDGNVNLCDFS